MKMPEEKEDKISIPLVIINVTLVGFVISLGCMIYGFKQSHIIAEKKVQKTLNMSAFDSMKIQAQSVFVWDMQAHKVLYAKNEKEKRPLASLTKIMMAVTARSLVPKDTTVVVKKEFLADEGDTGLYVNEKWRMKDLLDFSLVVSSNDGARSVASVIGSLNDLNKNISVKNFDLGRDDFIKKMNLLAQQTELSTLEFKNETGLDTSTETSGGYGSAEDIAKLVEYALRTYPDILEATKNKNDIIYSYDKIHKVQNTNDAISKIPNIIASKTGYTTLAGGNVVIAFDAGVGRPIIISLLSSTLEGRFTDIEQLASSTLEYIKEND
jgi:D-alanyl-D-alanine carboxypeptidase